MDNIDLTAYNLKSNHKFYIVNPMILLNFTNFLNPLIGNKKKER